MCVCSGQKRSPLSLERDAYPVIYLFIWENCHPEHFNQISFCISLPGACSARRHACPFRLLLTKASAHSLQLVFFHPFLGAFKTLALMAWEVNFPFLSFGIKYALPKARSEHFPLYLHDGKKELETDWQTHMGMFLADPGISWCLSDAADRTVILLMQDRGWAWLPLRMGRRVTASLCNSELASTVTTVGLVSLALNLHYSKVWCFFLGKFSFIHPFLSISSNILVQSLVHLMTE